MEDYIMAYKKFLTSVADAFFYDNNDNIIFTAKTLLDSSIEVSLGNAPVRGGIGNQLQYIYYHTGEMKFTLTDAQWNLALLGASVGSDYDLGSYYKEETVAVSAAGAGTVTETPLANLGGSTTVYGWATNPTTGAIQRVAIDATAKTFTVVGYTGEVLTGNWCIRYFTANKSEGRQITIPTNMIPKVGRLVLEAQLNSGDVSTNKIGVVQIIAPTVTLAGAFTISLKSDGVSTTPLSATALAYTPAVGSSEANACAGASSYYAKIVEIIDNTNWYDNVYDLSVYGGNFYSASQTSILPLTVYAIPEFGSSFKVPNSDLTFTTGCTTLFNIGAHSGSIVTLNVLGSGSAVIYVTAASAIDTSVIITVVSASTLAAL